MAHIGHATMMQVCNQCFKLGHTQRQAGSIPNDVATEPEDCHLVCIAVTEHTALSTETGVQQWV